jgi:hypothetical protein
MVALARGAWVFFMSEVPLYSFFFEVLSVPRRTEPDAGNVLVHRRRKWCFGIGIDSGIRV